MNEFWCFLAGLWIGSLAGFLLTLLFLLRHVEGNGHPMPNTDSVYPTNTDELPAFLRKQAD